MNPAALLLEQAPDALFAPVLVRLEAVTVLEPHAPANYSALPWHLIDLGRVEEAVAHLRWARSTPLPPADTTYADTPPF